MRGAQSPITIPFKGVKFGNWYAGYVSEGKAYVYAEGNNLKNLTGFNSETGVRLNTGLSGSSANILSEIQGTFPNITEQVNVETPVALGEALPGWSDMRVIT